MHVNDHSDEHAHNGSSHQGHSHGVGPNADKRWLTLALVLLLAFMVAEVVVGIMARSLALISDAGHMLTDALALALAYAAFRFGRRQADDRRSFGYLRFEVIAGLINALTLFAIVAWIGYEAWHRFRQPQEVLAGPMLLVAVGGLLVNILAFWILTRGDTDHVNIKGAALHVLGDLLGSVAAIIAAVVIYFTNWFPIDPILSVLVSLLILRSAWKLLQSSLHILLEGAPDHATPELIDRHLIEHVPGIRRTSHIHVWSITSGRPSATLEARLVPGGDPRAVTAAIKRALAETWGIGHSTVEVVWEGVADCALEATPHRNR